MAGGFCHIQCSRIVVMEPAAAYFVQIQTARNEVSEPQGNDYSSMSELDKEQYERGIDRIKRARAILHDPTREYTTDPELRQLMDEMSPWERKSLKIVEALHQLDASHEWT